MLRTAARLSKSRKHASGRLADRPGGYNPDCPQRAHRGTVLVPRLARLQSGRIDANDRRSATPVPFDDLMPCVPGGVIA